MMGFKVVWLVSLFFALDNQVPVHCWAASGAVFATTLELDSKHIFFCLFALLNVLFGLKIASLFLLAKNNRRGLLYQKMLKISWMSRLILWPKWYSWMEYLWSKLPIVVKPQWPIKCDPSDPMYMFSLWLICHSQLTSLLWLHLKLLNLVHFSSVFVCSMAIAYKCFICGFFWVLFYWASEYVYWQVWVRTLLLPRIIFIKENEHVLGRISLHFCCDGGGVWCFSSFACFYIIPRPEQFDLSVLEREQGCTSCMFHQINFSV